MIKQLRAQGAHIVDIAHRIGCSERTVRRYLALPAPPTGKPKNRRASKRTVRYETLPGKQLQHDWGEIRTEMGGRLCTVNFAVNILGYSRHFHVWAGPRQDAKHTYESLVQAFRYFGGVPASVLVDNQKAAVVRHDRDGNITFNAGFLELANHYGFAARACRQQRPKTKGKTERMVGYVKHHFFQRYRSFDSYAHLNQLLEHWLDTCAQQRLLRRFRQTPAERFQEEQPQLLPRPADDFDTRYYDIRHVGWDAYIDVHGNRYSVPADCCGQRVNIRISLDGELTVYDLRGQEVVQHRSLAVYEEVLQ